MKEKREMIQVFTFQLKHPILIISYQKDPLKQQKNVTTPYIMNSKIFIKCVELIIKINVVVCILC